MALRNNPFQFHDITFKLNINQLKILINLLRSSNPSGADEDLVVNIVLGLEQALESIEKE